MPLLLTTFTVSVVETVAIIAIEIIAAVVVHLIVDQFFAAVVVVDGFAAVVFAECCYNVYFLQRLILFLVFCRSDVANKFLSES